jgi:tRNA(Ile)-lysidine synthase
LAGMKWKSPSPGDPKVMLARPLLGCAKQELQLFAHEEKIAFREDKTNASLDFRRNRLRHELLPLLVKHYQPALSQTTLRLMEVLEAESDFVTQAAKTWLEKMEPPFARLHLAVQRRCLQLQLFRLGLDAGFDLIEHLRVRPGSPVTLNPGLTVKRAPAGAVQTGKPVKPEFNPARLDLSLTGRQGVACFGGLKIRWRIERKRQPARAASQKCEFFDADKVGSTIALRHWQPGDRFQPIGMRTSVKLQNLFSNLKVPRGQRHELTIAATSSGELFWVEGLRISERFKLDKGAVRSLNWCWQAS